MFKTREKKVIMDSTAIDRAVMRITHEIMERNHDVSGLVFLGIQRRGVPLAQRIASTILEIEGIQVPVGIMDITLYRDDLSELAEHPQINKTDIPFAVGDKTIVMVDDVIYTGRTARSAMDALIDLGRPRCIQLACLIDRGHRELPIRADYIGKNVPTSKRELVAVHLREIDGSDYVSILEVVD